LYGAFQILVLARALCLFSWLAFGSEWKNTGATALWVWVGGEIIKLIILIPIACITLFVAKEKRIDNRYQGIVNSTVLIVEIAFLVTNNINWAFYLIYGWSLWKQVEKIAKKKERNALATIATNLIVIVGFATHLPVVMLVGFWGETIKDGFESFQVGLKSVNEKTGFT
jgi:hypothetical protein